MGEPATGTQDRWPRRGRAVTAELPGPVRLVLIVIGVLSLLVTVGSTVARAADPPGPEPVGAPVEPPVPLSPGGSRQFVVVEVPPHTIPITNSGVGAVGLLPRTGGSVPPWLIQLAVGLIAIGTVLVVTSRRRLRHPVD